MNFNHVCVIGLGYIGLPTASILATQGIKITGVDVSAHVVNTINNGQIHFVEKDLDVLVHSAVYSGNFKATLTPTQADIFIIAVPTPFKDKHEPDLSFVEQAILNIAPYLSPGNLVILESTSPVGTTEKVAGWLHQARPDLNIPGYPSLNSLEQIYFAYCPERVLPSNILQELVTNDRIVGGIDKASSQRAKALYKIFSQGQILLTDSRTAEMSKLTENAFRDVNIAFANELANICDRLNINVWELIKLANHHPRVNILEPGPGVGGHCIAVDPWFIVDSAPSEAKLIRMAREVNDERPYKILTKIYEVLKQVPDAGVACLGLSFKANVDDLRESPAMEIVTALASQTSNQILVVEPYVNVLPKSLNQFSHVQLVDIEVALTKAKIIVLLVSHECFLKIHLDRLKEKIVLDTRGLFKYNPIMV